MVGFKADGLFIDPHDQIYVADHSRGRISFGHLEMAMLTEIPMF